MQILELRKDIKKKLKKYSLGEKFVKAKKLFESDMQYPSLNTELLKPKANGIYSFRLDRKYRAHFIFVDDGVEIIDVTLHYQ